MRQLHQQRRIHVHLNAERSRRDLHAETRDRGPITGVRRDHGHVTSNRVRAGLPRTLSAESRLQASTLQQRRMTTCRRGFVTAEFIDRLIEILADPEVAAHVARIGMSHLTVVLPTSEGSWRESERANSVSEESR
jgi:hypothetical protein